MQINNFLNSSLLRIYEQPLTQQSKGDNKEADSSAQTSDALTTAQKNQIAKLQATDSKVRKHEAAHIAAGGSVIRSGANFIYQKGPDKKLYAIAGEVAIDTAEETDPNKTVKKMQIVRTAALAPADPSPQDYQVASTASILEMKARLEISENFKESLQKSAIKQYANNINEPSNFSKYA